MWANKPGIVEVDVGRARDEELPAVIHIYRQHNGDCNGVGCGNTFVARNESLGVVGAVTVKQIQPGWVSLRTMGVEPELQRRGVGSQLLGKVIEEIKREGNRTITVDLDIHINGQKEFFSNFNFKKLDSDSMVLELK